MDSKFAPHGIKEHEYIPDAPDQHIIYITEQIRAQVQHLCNTTDLKRFEAFEQLLPQLQGKLWSETAGVIVVQETK